MKIIFLILSFSMLQTSYANSDTTFSCNKKSNSNKLRCSDGLAVNFPIQYVSPVFEDETTFSFNCKALGRTGVDVQAVCNINLTTTDSKEYFYKDVSVVITILK
ncbi:MAG: hypothetical protein Q7U04_01970 [Bacteriovorax sp.]|nr:hypothetical protein [Bacteriovorax sp.]